MSTNMQPTEEPKPVAIPTESIDLLSFCLGQRLECVLYEKWQVGAATWRLCTVTKVNPLTCVFDHTRREIQRHWMPKLTFRPAPEPEYTVGQELECIPRKFLREESPQWRQCSVTALEPFTCVFHHNQNAIKPHVYEHLTFRPAAPPESKVKKPKVRGTLLGKPKKHERSTLHPKDSEPPVRTNADPPVPNPTTPTEEPAAIQKVTTMRRKRIDSAFKRESDSASLTNIEDKLFVKHRLLTSTQVDSSGYLGNLPKFSHEASAVNKFGDQRYQLRRRVMLRDRRVGRIVFSGPVKFALGLWLGVQLEDGNGETDGTYQGDYYFTAPKNSSVFVAASEVAIITKELEKQLVSERKRGMSKAKKPKVEGSLFSTPGRDKFTLNITSETSIHAGPKKTFQWKKKNTNKQTKKQNITKEERKKKHEETK